MSDIVKYVEAIVRYRLRPGMDCSVVCHENTDALQIRVWRTPRNRRPATTPTGID